MNLYKELNSFTTEEEIEAFIKQLNDRFGDLPTEIYNICDALRIRWLAKEIGFERIILKNSRMRAYFPSQADSNYYSSATFQRVLDYLKHNFKTCEIIENKGKLSILIKNINSINPALSVLRKIITNQQ